MLLIKSLHRSRPVIRPKYCDFQSAGFFWNKSDKEEKKATESDNKTVDVVDKNSESKGKSIISTYGDNSPRHNPILLLPIVRRPIFPGFMSAVIVTDDAVAAAISKNSEKGTNYLGLFLRTDKSSSIEVPELITSASQLHNVGTFVQVTNIVKSDAGTQLLVTGHRRLTLNNVNSFGPPTMADVIHWKRQFVDSQSSTVKAYSNELLTAVRELIGLNPLAQEHMQQYITRMDLTDPYKLADFAAALTTADGADLQRVLAAELPEERLQIALELVSKERELAKLQKEITRQVEEKISKQQKEYFLREQLKSIKNELGIEKDDKDELLSKYAERVKALKANPLLSSATNKSTMIKVIEEENKKLSTLEKNSPEFNVTRSYLDWLISIPWGEHSDDKMNLKDAEVVLNRDHFGMDEVKKRILEYIAVGKLKGTMAGKIVCLIGPPGVGKTSIAKSIASALNKEFYRFSVGGLTDMAEIKGHRRTYIGAMPGKPIQCLKSTKVMNPLILIDEIDKLGRGHNGDPASALLELLDPNQNDSFVDHYLDVSTDFSKVLFVCTANDEGTIPGPLRDRMEIIRLTGYDIPEKIAIASKYLVPKALKDNGLENIKDLQVTITEDAIEKLVKNYCRESGVRSLEKHVDKLARKIAAQQVQELEVNAATTVPLEINTTVEVLNTISVEISPQISNESGSSAATTSELDVKEKRQLVITTENLSSFIGNPQYTQMAIYECEKGSSLPVGVVMGLAWSPMGGSPCFIETAATPSALNESGGGVHVITGQLGSVMKESVNIAYTFARQFVAHKNPDNLFFKSHHLHVHVPEGAVEKDGPSAGVAMCCSLISIATNTPLRANLAMTGELSLTGKVLPVGGIKEKALAAKRTGADTLILPAANKKDFDELPDYVKEHITVHFVTEYTQAYAIAFPNNSI